jgi:hypothetical protein
MPVASTYPARALTNILGLDASGNVGIIKQGASVGSLMLPGQFGVTDPSLPTQSPDVNSLVTLAAPASRTSVLTTIDNLGAITRTFSQSSGRIDLFASSSSGQTAGPPMVLQFNNVTPANGDELGHYAYRGKDSNGNFNTMAYIIGTAMNVSAASASSALTLGVMRNLATGAGDAQPNTFVVIDGSSNLMSLASGMGLSLSGNSIPITATNATGPEFSLTNSTNTRTVRFGLYDGVNATIDSLTGGFVLRTASTVALIFSSSGAGRIIAELISSKTANYTVLTTDGGLEFDNTGAAGEVDFTLPSAPVGGTHFGFTVIAAQTVKIIAPAAGTINVGGTVSAASGNVASSQVGAYIHLKYVGSNKYVAKMATGTGGSTSAGGWTVT